MFRDLQKAQSALTGIAAHREFDANFAFKGETAHGEGMMVSGSYFQVLELTPALGRLINSGDDATIGQSPVVVLSHSYWSTRFGASPNVINDTLIVNGQPLTIVGVAPRGFNGTTLGTRPDVFVPITLRGQMTPGFKQFDNRQTYWVYLFGRLKPGVGIEQARSGLNVPYHAIVTDVEAPLQKNMSAKTLERFKAKLLTVEPGARGQSSMN